MTKRSNPQIRIGISGWTYAPWRGVFYPKKWPQKDELSYASRKLNSIEINGSFYSLQRPSSYQAWYDATPEDFVFSVKGGQFITHMRRLKDVEKPLANFWASGILGLKEKLGPILWQLPPNFAFDADRLDTFFQLLPRDTAAAARAAKHHDARLKGRVLTTAHMKMPLRYAMEVRHESFKSPEFIALLRRHNIALVIADTAGTWPFGEDITADFLYLRMHGDQQLYASGYTDAALDHWASRLKLWKSGRQPKDAQRWSDAKPPAAKARDLFCYFDNDVKVKAPFDAMALARQMGLTASQPEVAAPRLTNKALAERVRSHWPVKKASRRAKLS
jgi:uncharacterized protein YecE (DUF72 family)